jgi:hypothetical protein
MEEVQELLTEFVSRTLKIDKSAVTSALFTQEGDILKVKSDALDFLISKDAGRVTALSGDATKKFQDGYQKAKKEERQALEEEIKGQYGIQSDAKGVDLIAELLAQKTKSNEITEDVIMKHPAFIKKERELIQAKENAVKEILDSQKKEKNLGIFTTKALEELDKLNPVLPEDVLIAKKQKELYLRTLATIPHDITDDGTIILLNGDGTRKQDQHGHAVSFNEFVKGDASNYFQFRKADDRQNGDDPSKKGQGQGGGMKKPANQTEYLQRVDALMKDRTMSSTDRTTQLKELQEISKDLPQ